jgi:hypothetical protein
MGEENGRRERLEQVTESLGVLMWRGHRQCMVAAAQGGHNKPPQ